MRIRAWLAAVVALLPVFVFSQDRPRVAVIAVDATHPGAAISPTMFGIFFEDINFGADGGLYPELVKNRSFEFQEALTGWHEVLGFDANGLDRPKGALDIRTERLLNETNTHYLRAGEPFQSLWSTWRDLKADLVDEHYYMSPAWFLANSGRYDKYPRSGPKVFAGEYAAQSVGTTSSENRNNWKTAIAEAAFMTGLQPQRRCRADGLVRAAASALGGLAMEV